MGVTVDFGQVGSGVYIDTGQDATWRFEWSIDAGHYISVDAVPMRILIPDPANPGRFYPSVVEIVRQWTEVDDLGTTTYRFVTFRNSGPAPVLFLPTLIRVPNL